MVRLVINADDLGLHPRIDEGILRAHREGVLTSATVLVTGPCAGPAAARAREQGLALGVHLCLTTRLPPAAGADRVPTLAPGGRFRAAWPDVLLAWMKRELSPAEVALELEAQVTRARELGMEPDHLDSHQHLHLLPGLAAVVQELAARERLPLRLPLERPRLAWARSPGAAVKTALLGGLSLASGTRRGRGLRCQGIFEAGRLSEERLLALVERLGPGEHEIGCHPGLDPGAVPEDPGWHYEWEAELAALCSPRVRARIAERGIELTTYAALGARNRANHAASP